MSLLWAKAWTGNVGASSARARKASNRRLKLESSQVSPISWLRLAAADVLSCVESSFKAGANPRASLQQLLLIQIRDNESEVLPRLKARDFPSR